MIKFFRKIRRGLLIENKFSKYLLYAIGEIILVVIGILIALQINNWNTQKSTINTELGILGVMQKNLNSDLEDMQINLKFYKIRQRATKMVLQKLNDPTYKNDSLSFSYANLGLHPYFIETTSAYDNLKSMGFEIIKNDSLKENIMHIYSSRYQWIENIESDHSYFYKTKLEPLLIDNLIRDAKSISAKPINIKEIEQNHQFKESLKSSYNWLTFIIACYKELIIDVTLIEQQITTELEHRR